MRADPLQWGREHVYIGKKMESFGVDFRGKMSFELKMWRDDLLEGVLREKHVRNAKRKPMVSSKTSSRLFTGSDSRRLELGNPGAWTTKFQTSRGHSGCYRTPFCVWFEALESLKGLLSNPSGLNPR